MPEQLASSYSLGHNSPQTFVVSADCMDERPSLGVRELIIVFSFLCSGEQFVLRYRVAPQQFIPAPAEAALETPYFGPEPEPEP